MRELTVQEARSARLRAQGIDRGRGLGLSPAEVVDRGVAFQGQDLPAVLRAIALRSAPGTTVEEVREAFDRGELVRGWSQRGTLFATTPRHLATLLGLTAARVEQGFTTRRRQLGLEEGLVERAREVAAELLAGGGATRAELLARWSAAGVPTDGQRGYHLIFLLSTRGLLHWGPFAGAEQLLVASPPRPVIDPAAALVRIARGYLLSHAPATEADLAWWLGLPKTPVRSALASLGDELVRLEVGGRPHLALAGSSALEGAREDLARGVRLLPGFDEWILGYQDRALVASPASLAALVPGGNGVFRPAVLVDGRVVGSWRLAPRTREALVELSDAVSARTRREIDAAVSAWPH